MSGDPDMRARDADRARIVEELQAAYVDGQLDDEEREVRVSAAMRSRTLGELDPLVADLQSNLPIVRPPADVGSWAWRAGVAAAAVLLVIVGWQVVSDGSDNGSGLASGSVAGVETSERGVLWSEVKGSLARGSATEQTVQVPGIGRWDASMSDIAALIDAYRDRNGDYIAGASFYPSYGSIDQPLRGSMPGQQTWSFYADDPVFRSSSATTVQARDMTLLDLNDLDLDRLGANLDHALRALNVEGAQLLYINVDVASGEVSIYVQNKYSETAYLTTAPSGDIISETEFSGA